MDTRPKIRLSNLELLRIISMLLIVLQHYGEHSLYAQHEFCGAYLLFGGGLGVNLFILISGFFMVKSTFSTKKLLNIWFHVASIYLIISVICWHSFSIDNLPAWGLGAKICELFPILTGKYWFISTYVLLMLLVPLLNNMIQYTCKRHLICGIAALFIFGSLTYHLPLHSSMPGSLAHFIMLYLTAAYIRLYVHPNSDIHTYKWVIGSIGILAFISGFVFIAGHLSNPMRIVNLISADKGAIIFVLSIFVFMTFLTAKTRYNKMINSCAACTFGVYLIHEHPLLKNKLWQTVANIEDASGIASYALCALLSVSAVYIACSLLTFAWKISLESAYKRFLEKKLVQIVDAIVNLLKKAA